MTDIQNDSYSWPMLVYMCTSCVYPLVSSCAHTFSSMSKNARHICYFLDYGAVNLFSLGSAIAYSAYTFPDALVHTTFRDYYVALAVLNTILSTGLSCYSRLGFAAGDAGPFSPGEALYQAWRHVVSSCRKLMLWGTALASQRQVSSCASGHRECLCTGFWKSRSPGCASCFVSLPLPTPMPGTPSPSSTGSQSPAVPRVCDPGYTHANGGHPSGQDSEEGVAAGHLEALLLLTDSRSPSSVHDFQPQQHNLFLSCSVSDSGARITQKGNITRSISSFCQMPALSCDTPATTSQWLKELIVTGVLVFLNGFMSKRYITSEISLMCTDSVCVILKGEMWSQASPG
ncbi:membrane progestin receptor gamma isoform X3 [Castor canadensis]